MHSSIKLFITAALIAGCTNTCDTTPETADTATDNAAETAGNNAENAAENAGATIGDATDNATQDVTENDEKVVSVDPSSTLQLASPTVASTRNMEVGKNVWNVKISDASSSIDLRIKGDVQEGVSYNLVDAATYDAAPGADAGATSGVDSEAVVATATASGSASGELTGTIQFSDVPAMDAFDYKMAFDFTTSDGKTLKGQVSDNLMGDQREDMSNK